MVNAKKVLLVFFLFLSALFHLSVFYVILYSKINPRVTPLMIMKSIKGNKINKVWCPIDKISINMRAAVISSEDQRFYEHHGFDIKAIKEAIEYNKRGYRTRGASTISQQVSKNVFLFPDRSWFRKALEAYFTILMEFYYQKDRILEIYLNIAETGRGKYGVAAASEFYFKRKPKDLTRYQAASIAASLPNPIIFSPESRNSFSNEKTWWILNHMNKYYYIKK